MTLLEAAAGLVALERAAQSVLIAQGDPVAALFVLESGAVLVERDGVPVARITTPGAVFGEMALLLGKPATATVRCETASVFRVADDPAAFLAEHPEAALELARVAAGRVDALTQYLVDVKRQYAEHGDHLGMLDTVLGALSHQQAPTARPGSARDPEG